MSLNTQPYKGARDFYPEDKRLQKYIFGKLRSCVESFGYHEYDAPILESFDIYAAKTGEEIVNEQLYSFEDKGGRKLAIRPEMTPSVSRMVAARRQELAYPLRWYSIPNLWRYERPQRGRLREHWQLNVDLFGIEGVEADAEIIQVADALLKNFGAKASDYVIRINSRKLVNFLLDEHLELPPDDAKALTKLIDRRSKMEAGDFSKALTDQIGAERAELAASLFDVPKVENLPALFKEQDSVRNLKKLFGLLVKAGVKNAVFDLSIMRGFDYYTDVVFEVFDTNPENNRSMFGGGRYDGMVGLFGVDPVPTVGFGMGDVTLQNFLEAHSLLPKLPPETESIAVLIGDVYDEAQKVLDQIRAAGINLAVDFSERKLDAQIKSAVKSGAKYVLFIGEHELSSGKFKLRELAQSHEQILELSDVISALSSN